MFVRGLALSLATLVAIGALSGAAEADHRKKQRRVMANDHYYAGPRIVQGIPGMRLFFGDYALSEEEFDQLYGTGPGRDRFDESYYEPEAVPSKKKPAAKSTAKVQKTVKETPGKKSAAVASSSKTSPTAEKKSTTAAAASALSCDKATSIVSEFGFTAVKAQSCKGKVYAFNATRDGKPFSVKVDSASGELTEVKKLQ